MKIYQTIIQTFNIKNMKRTKDIALHETEKMFWDTKLNPITGWYHEPLMDTSRIGFYDIEKIAKKSPYNQEDIIRDYNISESDIY